MLDEAGVELRHSCCSIRVIVLAVSGFLSRISAFRRIVRVAASSLFCQMLVQEVSPRVSRVPGRRLTDECVDFDPPRERFR